MNLIAVGPWYVVAPLAQCFASDGTQTHLSLRGGVAQWVGKDEKWQAWAGTEDEAIQLAATYGGNAAATKHVDERHIRRDWRGSADAQTAQTSRENPHPIKAHAHTREGEEIEP